MGFFSKLFSSGSGIEHQLELQYVPMLQSLQQCSLSEARETFAELLAKSKAEASAEGTLTRPSNYGDELLRRAQTEEHLQKKLQERRKEGVTDDDIRWWWNLHDLERRLMLKVDDVSRMAVFLHTLHVIADEWKGKSIDSASEEATKRTRRSFPLYGEPSDTSIVTGDDRPLPVELKDRINSFICRQSSSEPNEILSYSSCNAYIRAQVRNGKI